MSTRTLRIQRRGPGRPKIRDTETTTLNLDRNVLKHLKEMSVKYNLPANHIIENLVLSAVDNEYPLVVAKENSQLKKLVKEHEKRIKELESELERIQIQCGNGENPHLRELKMLKEESHRILDKYEELKVFELVMRLFKVEPGERLQRLTKRFIEDYFVSNDGREFISTELELKIIKNPKTAYMGWIVKKLQDS